MAPTGMNFSSIGNKTVYNYMKIISFTTYVLELGHFDQQLGWWIVRIEVNVLHLLQCFLFFVFSVVIGKRDYINRNYREIM